MMPRDTTDPIPKGLSPIEAAAHWRARAASDEMSPADEHAFEKWVDEQPANQNAADRVQEVWDIFEDTGDDVHVKALRQSALADAAAPTTSPWFGRLAVAAAAGLIVTLMAPQFLDQAPSVQQVEQTGPQAQVQPGTVADTRTEYVAATGERFEATLPDGTLVTLNTNTRIAIDFSSNERIVKLTRGQAFFKVAKNPDRPFIVKAADRHITALGTAFEVRLDPGRIEVVLTEGRVAITHAPERAGISAIPASEIVLAPGEALIAVLGKPQEVVAANIEQKLRWRDGLVEFQDTPLRTAVAEMSRYSNRPMTIADDQVGNLRISGVFRTGDISNFGDIVSAILPVDARTEADGTIELTQSGIE